MAYKRSTSVQGTGLAQGQGSSMKGQETRKMSVPKAPSAGSPGKQIGAGMGKGSAKMDGGKNITVGDSGLSRTNKGRNKL